MSTPNYFKPSITYAFRGVVILKLCSPTPHCSPIPNFLVKSQGHCTPWTMKSNHGRWPLSMVQLPYFGYFKNKQIYNPLGPQLGVNRMWTKRNDHPPNNECAEFYKNVEKKSSLTIPLVFSGLHLLLPKIKKKS